jgi:hypothetical protein
MSALVSLSELLEACEWVSSGEAAGLEVDKALLANAGQLDAWHRYEAAATEHALREWCESNGFELVAHGQAG